MKIKVSNSILSNQFKVISKLVPPSSGNICLEVKAHNLYLYSMNDLATYKSTVPCDLVEGDDVAFDVPFEALRTSLIGRKDVEFAYVNRMLVITEKGYKADLATTEPIEVEAFKQQEDTSKSEKTSEWKVSAEQGKWLQSSCSTVNLKAVEALSPFMPTSIKITSKGAFVCCYDANHMAFLHSNEVTGSLDVTMPSETLLSVFDAFSNRPFRMILSDSQLTLKSKLLTVKMSLPSSDSYLEVSELLRVANNAVKSTSEDITLNRQNLLNFLDSCKAVATKERSELQVVCNGKKLQLMVRTINGTIKQVFAIQNAVTAKFSLDFLYFEEAVRKDSSNEEITIKLVKDSFVVIGAKNGWCVVSLYE